MLTANGVFAFHLARTQPVWIYNEPLGGVKMKGDCVLHKSRTVDALFFADTALTASLVQGRSFAEPQFSAAITKTHSACVFFNLIFISVPYTLGWMIL